MVGQQDNSCQAIIDEGLRVAGADPSYVFRSNDNAAVQAMVRAGMGRAVLPLLAVDLADPDIVVRPIEPPIPDRADSRSSAAVTVRRHPSPTASSRSPSKSARPWNRAAGAPRSPSRLRIAPPAAASASCVARPVATDWRRRDRLGDRDAEDDIARHAPGGLRRRRRRRRPHPRTADAVGGVHRSAVPRPCAALRRSTSTGLEELEIDGQRSTMSRRGFPSDARGDGCARPRRDAEGPGAHVPARGAVRLDGPARADRGARRRAHRHRHPVHDRRAAVGGRGGGPGALAGVHEGLQPLDLRVLRGRAAAGADRAPLAQRPGGRGEGAGARRRRGCQGRLRRPVPPRRRAARTSGQRRGVRRRAGPRRAARRSTRRSSRSGPRARAWARGRTSSSCACWPRWPAPTACASSSRRCSTTACSTSSPS